MRRGAPQHRSGELIGSTSLLHEPQGTAGTRFGEDWAAHGLASLWGVRGDSLAHSGRVAAGPGQWPLERAVRAWTQSRRHIQWRMRRAIEVLSTESTSSVLQGREVDGRYLSRWVWGWCASAG